MNLRLLAHPARMSHRVDQLDCTRRERGGVGDAFTPLVSVPTGFSHPGMIAERAGSVGLAAASPAGGTNRVTSAVPVTRQLIPSERPNAFATGRSPKHSAVAVTEGLMRNLPREQVRGVLAHELAHVLNRDVLVTTVAAMIGAAITAVAHFLQFSWLFGGDEDDSPLGLGGTLAAILVAPIAAMILQAGGVEAARDLATRALRSCTARGARSRTRSSPSSVVSRPFRSRSTPRRPRSTSRTHSPG